ncbi:MAG: hypothetical protein P0S93_03705 [Candidatus Neptunochlamydia sp.]|nr:hypothetical protein [Candidatus Neptunochlamydia sp.]
MKFCLVCFIFIAQNLFAFTLQEKFDQGEPGSYIVTEQNELVSLLHLHSKKDHRCLFEEVSIPSYQSKKIDWADWIKKGAPGHTSWILYEVDIEKKCVTECYSLTRKAWIPTDEMDAFLIPLISLKLHFLSEEDRLQKGATARPGTVSSRPWDPPQVRHGKKVKDPQYDVYTAKWPHDSSNLSGKQIVLYFDKNEEQFPFPYWIQARNGALKFKMRAVDSGTGLSSPCTNIPRRKISFSNAPYIENGKLYLTLNVPTYYDNLQLYTIDLTAESKTTHILSYEQKRKKERLSLLIDEEKLDHLFTKGHEYLWIISSEDSEYTIESSLHTYIH